MQLIMSDMEDAINADPEEALTIIEPVDLHSSEAAPKDNKDNSKSCKR